MTVVEYHCKFNLSLCEVKINMAESKIHTVLDERLMACPLIILGSNIAIVKFTETFCCSAPLTRMRRIEMDACPLY